ncbi:MAG: ATP-binding cassette domain-containing protein [Lachnospiraceae bacterium]
MQKSDVLLEIRNIQASYKEYPALNKVSLDIKKNTVLGLVGESGSGKSTLAKVITGLLQADTGEVVFDGEMLYSKKSICIASNSVNKFKWYFKIQKVH